MILPGYDLERSDEESFKTGFQMMNLNQLTDMVDSLSRIIDTQEDQLRSTVQPTYRNTELSRMRIDTTLRSKVPENYMVGFNNMTKEKRQSAIHSAVGSVRSQKDQVAGLIFELNHQNRRIWRYEIAWHQKFTMPFACFIFFFIGAPLGAIIRKGGLGTPIIIATIFFVLYYVISMIGEKSAREGAMTPLEGIWMSTFIIFSIGVFLTWMATRDSSIFNIELYSNYIKKGLNILFVTNQEPRPDLQYVATTTDLLPENMIIKLEKLSLLCKVYLESDFKKHIRFSKIWKSTEDSALTEIANQYDYAKAIIKQADVEMMRETVAEYPNVVLKDFKIKKEANWQIVATAIIFPVWIYLYLKLWIQKHSLQNELQNIMGANRNLINELNSII